MFATQHQKMKPRVIFAVACALTLGAVVACDVSRVSEPTRSATRAQQDSARQLLGNGPKLLVCPTDESISNTEVVGPLGGIVSVGGTSISVPLGALLSDVAVTVTVPASQYMEVQISVAGTEHFLFEQPVTIAIDYSRCNSFFAMVLPLTAWYIDTETHDLLEAMPSVDDKLTQTVTFPTIHLSGYALAD